MLEEKEIPLICPRGIYESADNAKH